MKNTTFLVVFIVLFGPVSLCGAEQSIHAVHVNTPPEIDGVPDDPAWEKAQEIITHDEKGNIDITLKTVYTDKEIFMLIRFPDPDESRNHKSWTWNSSREIYTVGHDREDVFVLKWNMAPELVDLSIFADNPYLADIWYWKARRTDTAGYADDKTHILSPEEKENSIKVRSRSGNTMYLLRRGDDGNSAYKVDLIAKYQGDILPRYISQKPTGSRSDVQAKGKWQNNIWTIELRRKLVTGHSDDIQFNTDTKYLFGVSRYEIAGRKENKKLSAPLYGTGDVSERLWLEFNKQ